MNHKQLINAYNVLVRMGGAQMDIKSAMKLYKVRNVLDPYFNFCVEREQAIMDRYHGTVAEGNITFSNAEDAAHAQAELNELYLTDIDDAFIPVEIAAESLKDCTMSLNDMEALDGIIALT